MDTKEYIKSGVLELYAFDQLSIAERREVESVCATNPEVQTELEEIQSAIAGYAAAYSHTPDPSLRAKVLSQLNLKDYTEPKVIKMTPLSNNYRWMAIAATVLCLISLAGNLYFYHAYQNIHAQLAELQTKNDILATNNIHLTKQVSRIGNDLAIVADPANIKIELDGLPLSPAAKALIFWDKERKSTYINPAQLPPLAETKQYQLWAIVDGKPVDLGILPSGNQESTLLRMKDVSAAQAFAITIEPKGGSINPTLDQMVVMGKVL